VRIAANAAPNAGKHAAANVCHAAYGFAMWKGAGAGDEGQGEEHYSYDVDAASISRTEQTVCVVVDLLFDQVLAPALLTGREIVGRKPDTDEPAPSQWLDNASASTSQRGCKVVSARLRDV